MEKLETAASRLHGDPPALPTPVEAIQRRAAHIARRRRARTGLVAVVPVVIAAVAAWRVLAGGPGHHAERVATLPPSATAAGPLASPSLPAAPSTTPSSPPVTTSGGAAAVTKVRLLSARLGLAATLDPSGTFAHVWVTNDSSHWRDITPTAMSGVVDDLYALDSSHLWVATSSCATGPELVWRSTDGGASWSSAPAGFHSCSAGSTSLVRFADPERGWTVDLNPTGPSARLLLSTDGGQSWSPQPTPVPALGEVTFPTPTDGYVGGASYGNDKLYATHDAGSSWAPLSVDIPGDLLGTGWQALYGVPTFFDHRAGVLPVTLVKANTELVAWYTTADGGRTWSLRSGPRSAGISEGAPAEPRVALTSVTGPTTWWTLGRNRQQWEAQVTHDAGAHWVSVDSELRGHPYQLNAADGRTAWAGSNDAFSFTTDGGAHWAALDPHAQQSAATTPDDLTGTVDGQLVEVGGPAPGAPRPLAGSVSAQPLPSGQATTATVAEDGRFRLRVVPGRYGVTGTRQMANGLQTCTPMPVVVVPQGTVHVVVSCHVP